MGKETSKKVAKVASTILRSGNSGTEQKFSSNFEHLEGDTTGVIDPGVSFPSESLRPIPFNGA